VIVPASVLDTMNLGSTTGLVSLAKLQELERKKKQPVSGEEPTTRVEDTKSSE
jgi:hypothetical protein